MTPLLWLAGWLLGPGMAGLEPPARWALSYSAASIVNTASNEHDFYAPNTFVTIYGTNLAYGIRELTASDLQANRLPSILSGTGVRVELSNRYAFPFYVSPLQINFLIPASMETDAPKKLAVVLDGQRGPVVELTLKRAAPAFFQSQPDYALAAGVDGKPVDANQPATGDQWIILYATGLGPVERGWGSDEIASSAAALVQEAGFRLWLDDTEVAAGRIGYAGLAPGFAGVYQINVQLPPQVGLNPEVRMESCGVRSRAGVRLFARP
jgi:uncharacterized protein (TIGR03437 family)